MFGWQLNQAGTIRSHIISYHIIGRYTRDLKGNKSLAGRLTTLACRPIRYNTSPRNALPFGVDPPFPSSSSFLSVFNAIYVVTGFPDPGFLFLVIASFVLILFVLCVCWSSLVYCRAVLELLFFVFSPSRRRRRRSLINDVVIVHSFFVSSALVSL